MKKYVKVLLVLISFFMFSSNVFALYGNTTSEVDRSTLPKNGVNKKWKIDNSNIDNVLSTPYVDVSEKIYDYSGILTDLEKVRLKDSINQFIKKYNTDLVIVTVELRYTGKLNETKTEEFAADFYDYNDFGKDFSNYSGIVLVRNTYIEDKFYDMYTFGDAQLYFDQERYDQVLDDIYHDLSTGSYYSGFSSFIEYVSDYYKKGKPYVYQYAYIDDMGAIKYNFRPPYVLATIIGLAVSLIITRIYVLKNKMVKKAMEAQDYYVKSKSQFTQKEDNFVTSHTTSYVISSSSGGGSGGGHSSFGSSGGGHSSGGGRHG